MQQSIASKNSPDPVKMLIVSSDTYPPFRVDVTVLFGEELAARGHQMDWILQSEEECAKSYETPWGGGTTWVGETDLKPSLLHAIRKHYLGIKHDLSLFKRMREGDYDIIEVKDKFISGVTAAISAKRNNKKFVYWLSYPFPEEYLYRSKDPSEKYPFLYKIRGMVFKVLLYKVIIPRADHVFVQSEQMLKDVAAEGVPVEKMTAVPMGVKVTENMPVPSGPVKRKVLPEGEKCFLYLGTLHRVRRMDFVIRVLSEVLKLEPDAKLYLIGKGVDELCEKLLSDEAERLGVSDSLVMVGQLPQSEALEYVREADVCVSPLYPTPILNAGSPTKLVEYMILGKAVVANDHPEQCLMIDESKGGICVPYEEKAFANAVVKIMQNPDEALEMGARGYEYVLKNRSYQVLADKVESKLVEIVAKPVVKE